MRDKYFLYTGKCNTTAINNKDGNHILDQHGIVIRNPDLDKLEAWGLLKVYCPTFLIAFNTPDELRFANDMADGISDKLKLDIKIMKALEGTEFMGKFEEIMCKWIRKSIQNPDGFLVDTLELNTEAYRRSMKLQDLYSLEEVDGNIKDRLATTIGRMKAIYCAMAYHYAVEGHIDDQFVDFPYHLPTIVTDKMFKFDSSGNYYTMTDTLMPDMLRFEPIMSSISAQYVDNQCYKNWDDFRNRFCNKVKECNIPIYTELAESMGIDLERAMFAGWRMYLKDLRKRGEGFLYTPSEAEDRFDKLKGDALISREDRLAEELKRIERLGDDYPEYIRMAKLFRNICYINSYIGTWKNIPFIKDDKNFEGIYLPYNVMKSEKKRLRESVESDEVAGLWKPEKMGYRDIILGALKDKPNIYAKWYIPAMEDCLTDSGIYRESERVKTDILSRIG